MITDKLQKRLESLKAGGSSEVLRNALLVAIGEAVIEMLRRQDAAAGNHVSHPTGKRGRKGNRR